MIIDNLYTVIFLLVILVTILFFTYKVISNRYVSKPDKDVIFRLERDSLNTLLFKYEPEINCKTNVNRKIKRLKNHNRIKGKQQIGALTWKYKKELKMGVMTVIKDYGSDILETIRENDLQKLKSILENELKSDRKIQKLVTSDIKHKPTKKFACPLILAARQEDSRIIKYFLDKGVDPNFVHQTVYSTKRREKVTPLHLAVDLGLLSTIEVLLLANANPNIGDQNNETPLHIAIKKCDRKIVRMLLGKGADPQLVDAKGNASLHIATLYGHLQLVRALLHHGSDVFQKGNHGAIAPHIAAREGHIHLLQLFCSREVGCVNLRIACFSDQREKTTLHITAENGHKEATKALLEQFQADITQVDSHQNTSLHCVVLNEWLSHKGMRDKDDYTECARILLKHRVSINAKNIFGHTALHLAAANHYQKIVEILLALGANPFAEDDEGLKPIDMTPDWDTVTKQLLKSAMQSRPRGTDLSSSLDTLRIQQILGEFSIAGSQAEGSRRYSYGPNMSINSTLPREITSYHPNGTDSPHSRRKDTLNSSYKHNRTMDTSINSIFQHHSHERQIKSSGTVKHNKSHDESAYVNQLRDRSGTNESNKRPSNVRNKNFNIDNTNMEHGTQTSTLSLHDASTGGPVPYENMPSSNKRIEEDRKEIERKKKEEAKRKKLLQAENEERLRRAAELEEEVKRKKAEELERKRILEEKKLAKLNEKDKKKEERKMRKIKAGVTDELEEQMIAQGYKIHVDSKGRIFLMDKKGRPILDSNGRPTQIEISQPIQKILEKSHQDQPTIIQGVDILNRPIYVTQTGKLIATNEKGLPIIDLNGQPVLANSKQPKASFTLGKRPLLDQNGQEVYDTSGKPIMIDSNGFVILPTDTDSFYSTNFTMTSFDIDNDDQSTVYSEDHEPSEKVSAAVRDHIRDFTGRTPETAPKAKPRSTLLPVTPLKRTRANESITNEDDVFEDSSSLSSDMSQTIESHRPAPAIRRKKPQSADDENNLIRTPDRTEWTEHETGEQNDTWPPKTAAYIITRAVSSDSTASRRSFVSESSEAETVVERIDDTGFNIVNEPQKITIAEFIDELSDDSSESGGENEINKYNSDDEDDDDDDDDEYNNEITYAEPRNKDIELIVEEVYEVSKNISDDKVKEIKQLEINENISDTNEINTVTDDELLMINSLAENKKTNEQDNTFKRDTKNNDDDDDDDDDRIISPNELYINTGTNLPLACSSPTQQRHLDSPQSINDESYNSEVEEKKNRLSKARRDFFSAPPPGGESENEFSDKGEIKIYDIYSDYNELPSPPPITVHQRAKSTSEMFSSPYRPYARKPPGMRPLLSTAVPKPYKSFGPINVRTDALEPGMQLSRPQSTSSELNRSFMETVSQYLGGDNLNYGIEIKAVDGKLTVESEKDDNKTSLGLLNAKSTPTLSFAASEPKRKTKIDLNFEETVKRLKAQSKKPIEYERRQEFLVDQPTTVTTAKTKTDQYEKYNPYKFDSKPIVILKETKEVESNYWHLKTEKETVETYKESRRQEDEKNKKRYGNVPLKTVKNKVELYEFHSAKEIQEIVTESESEGEFLDEKVVDEEAVKEKLKSAGYKFDDFSETKSKSYSVIREFKPSKVDRPHTIDNDSINLKGDKPVNDSLHHSINSNISISSNSSSGELNIPDNIQLGGLNYLETSVDDPKTIVLKTSCTSLDKIESIIPITRSPRRSTRSSICSDSEFSLKKRSSSEPLLDEKSDDDDDDSKNMFSKKKSKSQHWLRDKDQFRKVTDVDELLNPSKARENKSLENINLITGGRNVYETNIDDDNDDKNFIEKEKVKRIETNIDDDDDDDKKFIKKEKVKSIETNIDDDDDKKIFEKENVKSIETNIDDDYKNYFEKENVKSIETNIDDDFSSNEKHSDDFELINASDISPIRKSSDDNDDDAELKEQEKLHGKINILPIEKNIKQMKQSENSKTKVIETNIDDVIIKDKEKIIQSQQTGHKCETNIDDVIFNEEYNKADNKSIINERNISKSQERLNNLETNIGKMMAVSEAISLETNIDDVLPSENIDIKVYEAENIDEFHKIIPPTKTLSDESETNFDDIPMINSSASSSLRSSICSDLPASYTELSIQEGEGFEIVLNKTDKNKFETNIDEEFVSIEPILNSKKTVLDKKEKEIIETNIDNDSNNSPSNSDKKSIKLLETNLDELYNSDEISSTSSSSLMSDKNTYQLNEYDLEPGQRRPTTLRLKIPEKQESDSEENDFEVLDIDVPKPLKEKQIKRKRAPLSPLTASTPPLPLLPPPNQRSSYFISDRKSGLPQYPLSPTIFEQDEFQETETSSTDVILAGSPDPQEVENSKKQKEEQKVFTPLQSSSPTHLSENQNVDTVATEISPINSEINNKNISKQRPTHPPPPVPVITKPNDFNIHLPHSIYDDEFQKFTTSSVSSDETNEPRKTSAVDIEEMGNVSSSNEYKPHILTDIKEEEQIPKDSELPKRKYKRSNKRPRPKSITKRQNSKDGDDNYNVKNDEVRIDEENKNLQTVSLVENKQFSQEYLRPESYIEPPIIPPSPTAKQQWQLEQVRIDNEPFNKEPKKSDVLPLKFTRGVYKPPSIKFVPGQGGGERQNEEDEEEEYSTRTRLQRAYVEDDSHLVTSLWSDESNKQPGNVLPKADFIKTKTDYDQFAQDEDNNMKLEEEKKSFFRLPSLTRKSKKHDNKTDEQVTEKDSSKSIFKGIMRNKKSKERPLSEGESLGLETNEAENVPKKSFFNTLPLLKKRSGSKTENDHSAPTSPFDEYNIENTVMGQSDLERSDTIRDSKKKSGFFLFGKRRESSDSQNSVPVITDLAPGVIQIENGSFINQKGEKVNKQGQYVNELGEAVDANGRLIDKFGRFVDRQGRFVNEYGHLINEYGQLINHRGRIVNEKGQLINSRGELINEKGHLINEKGFLVDDKGRMINNRGQLINERGLIVNELGQFLNDHGQPVNDQGQLVDSYGNILPSVILLQNKTSELNVNETNFDNDPRIKELKSSSNSPEVKQQQFLRQSSNRRQIRKGHVNSRSSQSDIETADHRTDELNYDVLKNPNSKKNLINETKQTEGISINADVYRPKPPPIIGNRDGIRGRYEDGDISAKATKKKNRTRDSEGEAADTEGLDESKIEDTSILRRQPLMPKQLGAPKNVFAPKQKTNLKIDNNPPSYKSDENEKPKEFDFSKLGLAAKLFVDMAGPPPPIDKSKTMYMAMASDIPESVRDDYRNRQSTSSEMFLPAHIRIPDEVLNAPKVNLPESDDRFLTPQWVIARGRAVRRKHRKNRKGKDRVVSELDPSGRQMLIFFKVGSNWPDLAIILFRERQPEMSTRRMVEEIRSKFSGYLTNQVQQLMRRWWKDRGEFATIEVLKSALDLARIPYLLERYSDGGTTTCTDTETEGDLSGLSDNEGDVNRLIRDYKVRSLSSSFDSGEFNLSMDNLMKIPSQSSRNSRNSSVFDESMASEGGTIKSLKTPYVVKPNKLKTIDYRHESAV